MATPITTPVTPTVPVTPAVAPAPAVAPTVSTDDLNAIRERIRLEERSKVQDRLSKVTVLEHENTALQATVTQSAEALASAKGELTTVQGSLDAVNHALDAEGNKVDVPKLIKEISDNAHARYQGEVADKINTLETSVNNMAIENGRLKVDGYKQTRLAQEASKGTKFIAELINGDTVEKVEASILNAIAKHREYFGETLTTPVDTLLAPPNIVPVVPAVPQGASPVTQPVETGAAFTPSPLSGDEGLAGIVKDMKGKAGSKTFVENREALLQAAQNEAAGTPIL
jgi:hypothetical protein